MSTDVNIGEHLYAGRLRQPPGGERRGGALERSGRGQLADRCRQPGRRVTVTNKGVNEISLTSVTDCGDDSASKSYIRSKSEGS